MMCVTFCGQARQDQTRIDRSLWMVVALLSAIWVGPGDAATLRVEADGSGVYSTIQAAVDAAMDGDEVELGPGVFRGPGNRDVDLQGKAIVVRSRSGLPKDTILDCEGSEADPHRGFLLRGGETRSTVLRGFTIVRGCVSDDGGALYASPDVGDHPAAVIERCVFANNRAYAGGGGAVHSNGPLRFVDCVFSGNFAAAGAGAIRGLGGPAEIVGCTFAGNRTTMFAGALGVSFGTTSVERTVFWGNCAERGDALFTGTAGHIDVRCSVLQPGGTEGIGSFYFDVDTVLESDPLFCEPEVCDSAPTVAGDYHVATGSVCLPDNNPCSAQIGALGVACGSVPTVRVSWGAVKSAFCD